MANQQWPMPKPPVSPALVAIPYRLAAEFFATFALVFAGCGAIAINTITGGHVSHVGIGLTFGLVVMAMIYAVGDVSGAHLNPAVSIAFAAARRFAWADVPKYIIAQCLGAVVAALTLRLLFAHELVARMGTFQQHIQLGQTLPRLQVRDASGSLQAFVIEFILTAILMVVILRVSTGPKEKGITAALAVGGVVALEAIFAGPITGASMNPARSLGPALVSGELNYQWIYLLAPTLGALAAVVVNIMITPSDEKA
jgi:aquaporin NIP